MRKSDRDRIGLFNDNFEEILEYMIKRHSRVLPVRVDLRFPQGYHHDGKNTELQRFHRWIEQHYRDRNIECRHHSVREQNSSVNPHYHVMLLLDGNRVRSPVDVYETCNRIWKLIVNSDQDGLVHYCLER